MPKQNIQRLIPGMLGAAEYGTARRAGIADLNAAGKTGSCIFNGSWIGLFASVAPVENPQYAVVVIMRGQSERGKYAALVAGKIYEALRPRFSDKRNNVLLAQFKPKHKVNNKDGELLSEDEDEDTGDGNSAEINVKDPNPKKGFTREITKTVDARNAENPDNNESEKETVPAPKMVTNIKKDSPKFNPVVIEYKKDTESTEPSTRPQITRPRVVVKNP